MFCLHACKLKPAHVSQKLLTSPGTIVRDGYKQPCAIWELNSGPLQEQPVLLTLKPSLQHVYTVLLGLFFYTTENHLSRGSTALNGLSPLILINQENALSACL